MKQISIETIIEERERGLGWLTILCLGVVGVGIIIVLILLNLSWGCLGVILLLLGYAEALRMQRYLTWLHVHDVHPERLLHSYVTRNLVRQRWYLPVLCWISFGRMRRDLKAYRNRINQMNMLATFDEPIPLSTHYEFHRTSFFTSGYRYIQLNPKELIIGNSLPIPWQHIVSIQLGAEDNSSTFLIRIQEIGKPYYTIDMSDADLHFVHFELLLKKMHATYGKTAKVEAVNPLN